MAIPPLLAPVQRSGHVQQRRRARGTDAGGVAVENNGHLQGEHGGFNGKRSEKTWRF